MLKRVATYTVLALLFAAFAGAAADYVIFVYRLRHGTALGVINVRQFLSTPLKNGRNELDFIGDIDQHCVRALLPHQQMEPCWWVRAHKDRWTQS